MCIRITHYNIIYLIFIIARDRIRVAKVFPTSRASVHVRERVHFAEVFKCLYSDFRYLCYISYYIIILLYGHGAMRKSAEQ